jgi:sensor histidine kinase YesM
MVSQIILQPLVENAIHYGIESRETGGTMTVRAYWGQEIIHLESGAGSLINVDAVEEAQ